MTCCCSCAPSASAEALVASPCIASSNAVAASFSYWWAAVVRALKMMVRSASVRFDIYFLRGAHIVQTSHHSPSECRATFSHSSGNRSASNQPPERFSSATPSKISRVPIRTRIDPTRLLHKRLQPDLGRLAASDIPQCPRLFTDRLVIGITVARVANDRSDWVYARVEGETREFERMPQKPLGSSPYPVMSDDCKHSF